MDELRDVENFEPNMTTAMKLLFFRNEMFAAFIYYLRRNFLVLAFIVLLKAGADAQKKILGGKDY